MKNFWFICFLVVQTRKYLIHMDIQEVWQSCYKFCKACCTPPTHILTSTLVFHFTKFNKHWIDKKAKQNWPCFKIFVGNFSNLEIWKFEIQLVDFKFSKHATGSCVATRNNIQRHGAVWNKARLMADRCWPKCSNSLKLAQSCWPYSDFFIFFFFNCNQNLM